MRPEISEFTYGYAITDELIHDRHKPITIAPVFPSLYQEGQKGGGYDVRIDRLGIPLFLQFKLSHYFRRKNSREIKDGTFTSPFYRMYLMPLKNSDQHNMLLDLEQAGNKVYYCAPIFYQPKELNETFLNHRVAKRSLWIHPSWIGVLPDRDLHYVAFQSNRIKYLRSRDKKIIEQSADYDDFIRDVLHTLKDKGREALQTDNLEKLASFMREIIIKNLEINQDEKMYIDKLLEKNTPIKKIAFYSSVYFDCQLYTAYSNDKF